MFLSVHLSFSHTSQQCESGEIANHATSTVLIFLTRIHHLCVVSFLMFSMMQKHSHSSFTVHISQCHPVSTWPCNTEPNKQQDCKPPHNRTVNANFLLFSNKRTNKKTDKKTDERNKTITNESENICLPLVSHDHFQLLLLFQHTSPKPHSFSCRCCHAPTRAPMSHVPTTVLPTNIDPRPRHPLPSPTRESPWQPVVPMQAPTPMPFTNAPISVPSPVPTAMSTPTS